MKMAAWLLALWRRRPARAPLPRGTVATWEGMTAEEAEAWLSDLEQRRRAVNLKREGRPWLSPRPDWLSPRPHWLTTGGRR